MVRGAALVSRGPAISDIVAIGRLAELGKDRLHLPDGRGDGNVKRLAGRLSRRQATEVTEGVFIRSGTGQGHSGARLFQKSRPRRSGPAVMSYAENHGRCNASLVNG